MSPFAIAVLVALTVFAVYRQSIQTEVVGSTRFKLALIYAIVGIVIGGFHQPESEIGWVVLVGSLLASVAVGVARGRLTTLTLKNGRIYSRGTALTIGLFVGLVACKFALGAYQYVHGINSHGGFGEVLVMIAVMVAFQAELIWRRACALRARTEAGVQQARGFAATVGARP